MNLPALTKNTGAARDIERLREQVYQIPSFIDAHLMYTCFYAPSSIERHQTTCTKHNTCFVLKHESFHLKSFEGNGKQEVHACSSISASRQLAHRCWQTTSAIPTPLHRCWQTTSAIPTPLCMH
ncbi:hypothetical protein KP509_33G015900 [Ceratopteris richardii]|uniref:Uncharacterized protein n=1 Tax=Ceratopteris richardii TaxID=49495 RepID=A0A8T2QMK4_CERRI|nr:hypothetical protein KP509_33G015900 [Ceratopteris richardii]